MRFFRAYVEYIEEGKSDGISVGTVDYKSPGHGVSPSVPPSHPPYLLATPAQSI